MFVCAVPKISRHDEMAPPSFARGTTAAELHNSVSLLCDTTVAETFER